MKYEVTAAWAQTVDGLGVFAEGETRVFTQEEADSFEHLRGMQLLDANVPAGMSVVIVMGGDD